ncbi:tetratricopeptide repeat protein [Blastopirellula marina]|nr:tetratricopeptide repeat protein [Blastopirellula marina]
MPRIMILLTALLPTVLLVTCAAQAEAQVETPEPTTAREYYLRGMKREKAAQFQEAIADYKKAGELAPDDFDVHFTLSSLYANVKDYPAAIDALAKSLKARPKDYSALFNAGLYHEYLHNFDQAIAFYTQASSEDANFAHTGDSIEEARAHAFHYRGRIYQWHKKDNAKAVADFTEALRLDPDIRMVRYRRAVAYHDLREYKKAHADFAAARQLDPDYSNLLNAWAWQLATCPDSQYRDGPLALQLAKKTNDLNMLAAAYAELGEFGNAVAFQKQALQRLEDASPSDNQPLTKWQQEQKEQMQARLATYESKRPYRDE